MADIRYFAEQNGAIVQLTSVWHDGHISTKPHHFFGTAPDGSRITAQRAIEFKRHPKLHKCDDRCVHARGHKCECSCGGANHGKAA